MTSETPTQRLGRLVRARRKSLRLTQLDVQNHDGPSTATLRLIEGGKHADFRDGTGAALEAAIHWAPGSIDQVLAGGEPILLIPGTAEVSKLPLPAAPVSRSQADLTDVLAMLEGLPSALETIQRLSSSAEATDETRAQLEQLRATLGRMITLFSMACELVGESLSAESITFDDIGDFKTRLGTYIDQLELIQAIATRLVDTLENNQIATKTENDNVVEITSEQTASTEGNENEEDNDLLDLAARNVKKHPKPE